VVTIIAAVIRDQSVRGAGAGELDHLLLDVSEAVQSVGAQRVAVIGEGDGAGGTRNLAEGRRGAYRLIRVVHIGPEPIGREIGGVEGKPAATIDDRGRIHGRIV